MVLNSQEEPIDFLQSLRHSELHLKGSEWSLELLSYSFKNSLYDTCGESPPTSKNRAEDSDSDKSKVRHWFLLPYESPLVEWKLILSLHLSPSHGSHSLKGPFSNRVHLWSIITYQFLPPLQNSDFENHPGVRLCVVVKEDLDPAPPLFLCVCWWYRNGRQKVPALQRY